MASHINKPSAKTSILLVGLVLVLVFGYLIMGNNSNHLIKNAIVSEDTELPSVVDVSALDSACDDGTVQGKFFTRDGSCTDAPAKWVAGKPGSLGKLEPNLNTDDCQPDENDSVIHCEVDGPSLDTPMDLFIDKVINVEVLDGPENDLRIYSHGKWIHGEILADGQADPIATLDPASTDFFLDVDFGNGVIDDPDPDQYSRIILRLYLDHTDIDGALEFELFGVKALHGGSGKVINGIPDGNKLFYLVGGELQNSPPPGNGLCNIGGGQGAFFEPNFDSSGNPIPATNCIDDPGVFISEGPVLRYAPAWTQQDCSNCASEEFSDCVYRDPSAYADGEYNLNYQDKVGPDIIVTSSTLDGWESALIYGSKGTGANVAPLPDPADVLGTDVLSDPTLGSYQVIDFDKDNNGVRERVYIRANNAGTYCDGIVISLISAYDGTYLAPASYEDCGDSIRSGNELCDNADLGGHTCTEYGYGEDGTGNIACACTNNDCQPVQCKRFGTTGCGDPRSTYSIPKIPKVSVSTPSIAIPPGCGNNRIDTGEACDGSDLGDKFCSKLGFNAGVLRCKDNCLDFDVSKCVSYTTEEPDCFGEDSCIAEDFQVVNPVADQQGLGTRKIARALIGLVGTVAIFYIIWSGLQLITAGSDQEKIKKARRTLLGAVVGLALVILSYVIVTAIINAVYSVN